MSAARPEMFAERFIWGPDTAAACRCVREDTALLKILLKTRNEHLLIERWLAHYLNILGANCRIIVLDNMSTDERVFAAYARHSDNIILIQYDGNVDSAHSPARFGELYGAVRASSGFYALLDTDEFLCLYDGQSVIRDSRILSFLQERKEATLFPSMYLYNLFGRDDAFFFEPEHLRSYHLDGKPVLNAAVMEKSPPFPVGHNKDLPVAFFDQAPSGLLLLHMTNLSREQRIRANMQKLAAFGIIRDEKDFITVLHADEKEIAIESRRAYVRELRWLLSIENEQETAKAQLSRSHVAIAPDGSVHCIPEDLAPAFARHAGPDRPFLELLDPPIAPGTSPTLCLKQALNLEP